MTKIWTMMKTILKKRVCNLKEVKSGPIKCQPAENKWYTRDVDGNVTEMVRIEGDYVAEEIRIESPPYPPDVCEAKELRAISSTGGQKGRKLEEFALVPAWPRSEVARVYGYGAEKYEEQNWRLGYPWTWSLSALYRHITKFELGESNDPESGLHHLAHAAFHLNTLMEYDRLGLGEDDREIGDCNG